MLAFFSMVEKGKKLHRDIMDDMGKQCSGLLHTTIPYVTEIEKMGLVRPSTGFRPELPGSASLSTLVARSARPRETVLSANHVCSSYGCLVHSAQQ